MANDADAVADVHQVAEPCLKGRRVQQCSAVRNNLRVRTSAVPFDCQTHILVDHSLGR